MWDFFRREIQIDMNVHVKLSSYALPIEVKVVGEKKKVRD